MNERTTKKIINITHTSGDICIRKNENYNNNRK